MTPLRNIRGAVAGLVLAAAGLPGAAQEFSTLKGHGGPIMGVAVSPSGRLTQTFYDSAWADSCSMLSMDIQRQ